MEAPTMCQVQQYFYLSGSQQRNYVSVKGCMYISSAITIWVRNINFLILKKYINQLIKGN